MDRRAFLGLLLGAPAFPKVMLQAVHKWSFALEAAKRKAQLAELVAIMRRAFVPKLVAQLYKPSPLLAALLRKG